MVNFTSLAVLRQRRLPAPITDPTRARTEKEGNLVNSSKRSLQKCEEEKKRKDAKEPSRKGRADNHGSFLLLLASLPGVLALTSFSVFFL